MSTTSRKEVGLNIVDTTRYQIITVLIFLGSILMTAFEILPVQISFATAALFLVIFKIISPREFYESIEFPTITMIGSLFSLGQALETSGGSDSIAFLISKLSIYFPPSIILAILMSITIVLTNLINNNAATILMAPIGLSVASTIGVSYDAFLMAVCIATSTSFMTPIAHQSNTLVMGPGGYKFTDYWQLGLPLINNICAYRCAGNLANLATLKESFCVNNNFQSLKKVLDPLFQKVPKLHLSTPTQ